MKKTQDTDLECSTLPLELSKSGDKILVGIDPGKKGYACVIVENTMEAFFYPLSYSENGMLDCVGLLKFLMPLHLRQEKNECSITLEKLHFIPGRMGGKSLFEMSRCFGAIEGVLEMVQMKRGIFKVRPAVWKNRMSLCGRSKMASVHMAKDIMTLYGLKYRGKKALTHDAAEAFLIALAGHILEEEKIIQQPVQEELLFNNVIQFRARTKEKKGTKNAPQKRKVKRSCIV